MYMFHVLQKDICYCVFPLMHFHLSCSSLKEACTTYIHMNLHTLASLHCRCTHKNESQDIPPTPSPATRLPPRRPLRLPSTISVLNYLCASEKRASRVVSVLRLTRPHAQVPRPRRGGRLCRCARR